MFDYRIVKEKEEGTDELEESDIRRQISSRKKISKFCQE